MWRSYGVTHRTSHQPNWTDTCWIPPRGRVYFNAAIFSRKTWQFGQVQQIYKRSLNSNRRWMAPSGSHPTRRRPSATHSRTLPTSQARQGSLPGLFSRPTRTTTRFRREDRIRQEVDLHCHYKRRIAVLKPTNEMAILRRRRTPVPTGFSTQGRQDQFENSQQ